MKALVTGGDGFIGSYLCRELLRRNWEVKILDLENKTSASPESAGIDYLVGNICDSPTVSSAMEGMDLIIHLAAKHRFFGISPEEFYNVNVNGTKTILEGASKEGINNIIFYSSVAVYGDQTPPTDENTTPRPNTPYGSTKLEAEKLVHKWVSEGEDRSALIIRPTVVFGPRNRGNMYRLIRQIDNGLYIPVGKGENIKSVAYVENLVDATLYLMDRRFTGVDIYNYADEPHVSFKEIVDLICRCLGRAPYRFHLPVALILMMLKPFDFLFRITGLDFPVTPAIMKMNKSTHHAASKIRKAGFKQIHSLEKGLTQMIKWYRANKEAKELREEVDE